MSKVLGSWSGMRKYLEQEMLTDSLQGRVRYNCTTYVGMDGCKTFEIFIDNLLVKQFSWETVNTYFINNGIVKKDETKGGISGYWGHFWETLDKYPLENRTEYTDSEFCDALEEYRNQPIEESLNSENPIVRMFAILDRRVGKRTLAEIKDNFENQPEWLKSFYELRIKAENNV